jgi:uncharacterized OB-fold protein
MAEAPESTRPDVGEQTRCDRCHGRLTPGAAYCDRCGARTRRAVRNVRLAIRIELLFILLIFLVIAGFAAAYYQR